MTSLEAAESERAAAPPRAPFWISILIVVVWVGTVAALTWTSANPVTLNQQQILNSDLVVVGKVVDDPAPRYVIEPVDHQPWPLTERRPIGVSNLPGTEAHAGQTYIFPLTRHAEDQGVPMHGDYFVTPSHLPNAAPLIYPATPAALKQLEQILMEPPSPAARPPRVPVARD